MDVITELPKSNGKKVIILVVNCLTNYAHFIALNHPYIAISVSKDYIDVVFKLHGLPNLIVNDKDLVILSKLWYELFK